jgi:hypothetical protein
MDQQTDLPPELGPKCATWWVLKEDVSDSERHCDRATLSTLPLGLSPVISGASFFLSIKCDLYERESSRWTTMENPRSQTRAQIIASLFAPGCQAPVLPAVSARIDVCAF